jgi:N-acetylglucosamine kinase-like BadF-type ATPase
VSAAPTTAGLLVAVDVGGSSSRAVVVDDAGATVASAVAPGAAKTGEAIGAAVLAAVRALLAAGESRLGGGGPGGVASGIPAASGIAAPGTSASGTLSLGVPVLALAAGATGMSSLAANRAALAARLVELTGAARVALAADALTAHLGALDGRPGAVLAVGTGAVALGRTDDGRWLRADGWGHLLGDDGGAAWLGAQGLRCALAAHDGRSADGAALLAAGRDLLGDPAGWPRAVHARDDPATLFAAFAPAVTGLAQAGDPAAVDLVDRAGRALAATAAAVLRDGVPPPVLAGVGGVLQGVVADALRRRLAEARPDVRLVDPAGDPLAGSVALARSLVCAAGGGPGLDPVDGLLWT